MSVLAGPGDAVGEIAALAGSHAAEADAERRVRPEVVDSLVKNGFTQWFVPTRWGNEPGTFLDLTRSVIALGESCASTSWLASLFAFSTRYLACFPERAQADVWSDGPQARIASVVKPLGKATEVEGGWRLSGTWTYASGVEYSDWAMLAGPSPAQQDQKPKFFLLPRSDYSFEADWSSLGMRGTASHSLTVDDVFVPEHRAVSREDAMAGRGSSLPGPAVPTLAVNGITFVAPAVGAAKGMLAAAKQAVSVKPVGPRAAAGQGYQVAFARAAAQIDTAEMLLERVAATADAGELTPEVVRRSRRDSTFSLEVLTAAVDGLIRVGGTRGQEEPHPMQRFWRDVHSVGGHAVMQFEPAALDYTQGLVSA
ncbi:acyl-CoA dehydrogenase family protein [Saccharopolyspora taberi]|uniref:Actinorhodin polyketide dimerase ActVA n=1 Tax=Saccharopolyspora taberi TaxID=60895 RepID=A0ABN3VBM6_9PSEU